MFTFWNILYTIYEANLEQKQKKNKLKKGVNQ